MVDSQAGSEAKALENQETGPPSSSSTTLNTITPFPQPFPTEVLNIIMEMLLLKKGPPKLWVAKIKRRYLRKNTIRLVCRTWNQLVTSNSALWTQFAFYLDADKLDRLQVQTEMAELQMSRSGNHGLHLYIGGQGHALKKSAESVKQFMSFIQQSSDRWESIDIFEDAFAWLFESLLVGPDGTSTRWNNLRALTASWCALIWDGDLTLPASHFPSLQVIHMNRQNYRVLSWDLPWQQLRDLSIESETSNLGEDLHTLRQCVNLERLALTARHSSGNATPPNSSVVLPSLLSFELTLEDCFQTLLTNVLPYLVLPRLQSLELRESWPRFKPTPSWTSLYALLQIIENSKCDLQELQVYLFEEEGAAYRGPALRALLQRTQQTLRKLVVEGFGLTSAFLHDFEPELLEDFYVKECLPEEEDEITRGLVRWLRIQKQREGATERLRRMETTFYCDDKNLVDSDQWKALEEEEWKKEQEEREEQG